MTRPPANLAAFLPALLAAALATAAAVELAHAYRVAAFGGVLAILAVPPIVVLFLYGPSYRSALPCFTALAAAEVGAALFDARSISAAPGLRVLMIAVATMIPVVIDLSRFDPRKGWRCAAGPTLGAILAFWVVFVPVLHRELRIATRQLRVEDGALLDRLEQEITIDGARLLIDDLDPSLARAARRRVAVRIGDELHPLSAARSETVVHERRMTRTLTRGGVVRSREVEEGREETVSLVVDLPASHAPEPLALASVRGWVRIASRHVSLSE